MTDDTPAPESGTEERPATLEERLEALEEQADRIEVKVAVLEGAQRDSAASTLDAIGGWS